MRSLYSFLICILFLSSSLMAQDRMADSLILVSIYEKLDGVNWSTNTNWLSDQPMDEWYGIKIEDDRVSELDLNNIGIKGDFPSEVYGLDALEELRFFNGELVGSLTNDLYKLTKLRELIIGNCGISGSIPNRLDSLEYLNRLDLQRNNLEGNLPELPTSITKIELWLNDLTGEIPNSWADLSLTQLNISSNNITGNFDILEGWKSIDKFNGSFNDFDSSPFPSYLGNMPNMRSFQCTDCNLEGELPVIDWTGSPKFYQLFVQNNNLTGDISRLQLDTTASNNPWINISFNEFTGTLPTHLLRSFFKFDASGNDFTEITTFDILHMGDFTVRDNQFSMSSLIDEMPELINHPNVSGFDFSLQRSIYPDDSLVAVVDVEFTFSADEEVEGAQYQWFYNYNEIEGANEYNYTINKIDEQDEGNYWCVLTHPELVDEDGEPVPFEGRHWNLRTEISASTLNWEDKVVVYPNPTTALLKIEGLDRNSTVRIVDVTGKQIIELDYNGAALDVSHLTTGWYGIEYQKESKLFRSTFIKR